MVKKENKKVIKCRKCGAEFFGIFDMDDYFNETCEDCISDVVDKNN